MVDRVWAIMLDIGSILWRASIRKTKQWAWRAMNSKAGAEVGGGGGPFSVAPGLRDVLGIHLKKGSNLKFSVIIVPVDGGEVYPPPVSATQGSRAARQIPRCLPP